MSGERTRIGACAVRRLGFGALRLLGPGGFGPPTSPDAAASVLVAAAAEVDLIDTADCYGPYLSEQMIARTLHPYRPGLVIATNGGLTCPQPGAWIPSAAPDRLRRCCEDSLRRLRVDRIELYQLHAVDPAIEFERSVEALAQLRAEGMVENVGLCNITAEQLRRAREIVPIVSVQSRFNIVDRTDDALIELTAAENIFFLPWFRLQRGDLARDLDGSRSWVARRHGATAAQVALAWLLHRSPNILPIPGTGSLDHLRENLNAMRLVLDEDEMRVLERCGNDYRRHRRVHPAHRGLPGDR